MRTEKSSSQTYQKDRQQEKNRSEFYLKGCVIISLISVLLMFLPWVTISVKGGSKGTYFLFQIKKFFTDVKGFTGVKQFDYSVLILVIPIIMFVVSLVSLFQFYYYVISKKSTKNLFLAYKQYSIFMIVNGATFILTHLIMSYVACNEILVKKVPFGYNPVHITPVPFVMVVLGFVGYFIFLTNYYQEVLYAEGAEYFVMPKQPDAVSYMKRSTLLLSSSVVLFLLSVVPMIIRAVYVIITGIQGKENARTAMFYTVEAVEYKGSIPISTLNLIGWVLPSLFTLLAIHASVRFIISVITRKNRYNIAVALKHSTGGVALSTLSIIITGWMVKLFSDTVFYKIPSLTYVLLILGCIGYFYLAKAYCAELCFEQGKHAIPVPRRYNEVN